MTDITTAEAEVLIAANRGVWAVIDTRQRFNMTPIVIYSKLATRDAAECARRDIAKNTVADDGNTIWHTSKPTEFYNLVGTFLKVLRDCEDTSDIEQLARNLALAHGGGMDDEIPF